MSSCRRYHRDSWRKGIVGPSTDTSGGNRSTTAQSCSDLPVITELQRLSFAFNDIHTLRAMGMPEDPESVDFSRGQEEAERHVKLLCTRLLKGWTDLQTSDMQVSRISGGISNLLVKVEPPPPLQPVAVKVFGDKTELLIDREAEKHLLLRLNQAGFGAPVVGLFGNGRIEQFLTAKTLTPEEMSDPRFIPHIARRLRAFHDLKLDAGAAATAVSASAVSAAGLTVGSTTSSEGAGGSASACSGRVSEAPPSQWDAMFGWLEMAEGLSFAHDPAKQKVYDKVDFGAIRAELTALREMCDRVGSTRVLCHNDLLSGNILVVQGQVEQQQNQGRNGQRGSEVDGGQESAAELAAEAQGDGIAAMEGTAGMAGEDVLAGGELQFIDFEYSCYGPRGFDWGNHFNEYAGFDCVYDRFPSPEQQKFFFRHYLAPGDLQQLAREHWMTRLQQQRGNGSRDQRQDGDNEPQRGGGGGGDSGEAAATLAAAEEAVLDCLVAEACVFALASHAYWGVWSFIQARYSPIDFDYLDYSRMRWTEYHRRKSEFFGMVHRAFPAASN